MFLVFAIVVSCLSMVTRYVSELLYIHTKLMIVDDRTVIVSTHRASFLTYLFTRLQMGSANLNDRSQKVSYLPVVMANFVFNYSQTG